MPDKTVTPAKIAASFDVSLTTRGWSTKDGIVDVCFKETGKVIDIFVKISKCSQCRGMKAKELSCEIEYVDF